MVVKVRRWVVHPSDLKRFFQKTAKFSKSFYFFDTEYHDNSGDEEIWAVYTAIGISRELIYTIQWEIELVEREELLGTDREYKELIKPWNGLVPRDEMWYYTLYPLAEDSFVDVFNYENFTQVDSIEDIEN